MPIGLSKAPRTLPKTAKKLWVDTFNGALEDCEGTTKECDERAAKIAWAQIRKGYRKMEDKWIAKSEYEDSYHDVLLTITKASLQPDGSVRWQAVASDTGKDKAQERTSVELFQDWIDRITYKADVGYLPAPKLPFLGVSHYPSLDGYGEAGVTRRMYIDGNVFKADGVFNVGNAIGPKLLDAVKSELALIKKGQAPEKTIRISAGWWDLQHYHDDSNYLFTRQALTDKCPLCEQGQTGDKIYKAGQLDHFAATRVPMNPRTSLELEEKSMAKITRREDAESIVGSDEAAEMERQARLVGKSDTEDGDELHPAMVVRAATKIGDFIKRKREAAEMSIVDLAAKTPVTDGTIGDIESGEIGTPSKPVIAAIAKALKVSEKQLNDMLPGNAEPADKVAKADMLPGEFLKNIRRKKKKDHGDVEKGAGFKRGRLKKIEDDEEEIDFETMAAVAEALDMDDEELEDMGKRFGRRRKADTDDKEDDDKPPAKGSKKEQLLARFGNKRRKMPPKHKADVEKNEYEGEAMMMPPPPLGGATSLKEADAYIQAQDQMDKMYSYWDMLQIAFGNIKRDDEIEDKLKAVSGLFREMAGKIDTLKAGLSDAFLIQESAAYDDFLTESDVEPTHIFGYGEVAEDAEEYIEYLEESDEVNIMSEENEITHPADLLKAAVDLALENKSLSGADREAAVQEAFNEFAEGVQSQLQEADPASQADQIATAIKGALSDVLVPLTEQVGLLTAKMAQTETPGPQGVTQMHEVYVPQQKSMMAPVQTPQPVQPMPGKPISPVTGKPSALTARIRKSVGLNS
jgi:transcriptional regulator with XRE-family HTH domain/cation transport regulator ChaB